MEESKKGHMHVGWEVALLGHAQFNLPHYFTLHYSTGTIIP
jgi:hypothetical protein